MKLLRPLCALIVVLGLFRTSVYAAVVINEIFPKTEDVTQEWIELYNTEDTKVSLNQWKLSHSAGDAKSFIFNAKVIDPHGFMLFSQPDTGISLGINGDTVQLTDDHGTTVDSKSYLGTLGYRTSMGRSPDGGSSWTICNTQTPNLPNDCPPASPTPTNTPTPISTNTPIPTTTEIPIPTENQPSQGIPVYQPTMTNSVLGTTIAITPTPTPADTLVTIRVPNTIAISKPLAVQIAVVVGAWIMLAFIAIARRKRKPRR